MRGQGRAGKEGGEGERTGMGAQGAGVSVRGDLGRPNFAIASSRKVAERHEGDFLASEAAEVVQIATVGRS